MTKSNASSPPLIIERDGPVLRVSINRADQRNSLSDPALIDAVVALCDAANGDHSIHAIVLTGAGTAFSAGGNVKNMRDKIGVSAGAPHQIRENYRHGIQRLPLALHGLEVPIIAAVNGPAIGAGLDLACMCDIRIAAQSATFAESFVRLGLVPGDGGAWWLPRIIGLPRATLLSLTGNTIDAATALEWGLVTQVVPDEDLASAAAALASSIAAHPSHALRMTKRLLKEGQHMQLPSLLELSAGLQALAHHAEDHGEAVSAVLEKRSPAYRDR